PGALPDEEGRAARPLDALLEVFRWCTWDLRMRQRYDPAPSPRGHRFDQPAPIARKSLRIEARRGAGNPRPVQDLGNPDGIADRTERCGIDAPELMSARNPLHEMRTVLEATGVKPGRRRQRFSQRNEIAGSAFRPDTFHRADRSLIAIGEVVRAVGTEPASPR